MSNNYLTLKDLHVTVDGKEILAGVDLKIEKGEVHALMGPNGSGKTTLANALMGHPRIKLTQGQLSLDGEDITNLSTNERAKRGLFIAFQYPPSVPGVSVANFLRTALNSLNKQRTSLTEFHNRLKEQTRLLGMDESFISRYVNDGFSGGEKKRLEILQMAMLKPGYAVLDEPDSGLDVDALRIVADNINRLIHPECGVLLITHYQRLLQLVKPHYVHIIINGRLIRSGGSEIVELVDREGYEAISALGDKNGR